VVAFGGFAVFSIGLPIGAGVLVAAGLATTALSSALATGLATDPMVGSQVVPLVIGASAIAALVAADGSWWLRREPQVERAVYTAIGRRWAPAMVGGAAMAVLASGFARSTDWSIWFLPLAVAVAAALTAAVGYAIGRGRGRSRDSANPTRRRAALSADDPEWDPYHP
jgi:hypothetical protein